MTKPQTPTDGDALVALALRVEQAGGPDRELDAEIALALGIVRERDGNTFYGHKDYSCMVLERGYYDHEGNAPELPAYTASLDAAMTLAKPNWWLEASLPLSPEAYGYSRVEDRTPKASFQMVGEPFFAGARSATLPLAICAAALRALTSPTAQGEG